jgi:hypothetical protein
MIMNKYTFVLDIVADGELDTQTISDTLIALAGNENVYAAVKPVKVTALKEQGFKVWRARVAGITEESVNPKPVKAKKATPEVEVASAS